MVLKWVLKHKSEILNIYLPAYCPDPNPFEYLNHIMKDDLQRQIQPLNANELTITMIGIFKKLQLNPTKKNI
jgi:transposase